VLNTIFQETDIPFRINYKISIFELKERKKNFFGVFINDKISYVGNGSYYLRFSEGVYFSLPFLHYILSVDSLAISKGISQFVVEEQNEEVLKMFMP